jgi:hypothetical protein
MPLRRSLAAGNLLEAESAANELPTVGLEDALSLLLLMLRERDARYERAATRWLGRFLSRYPWTGLQSAIEIADCLRGLDGAGPDVARSRLAFALRGAGANDVARVVERG